MYSFLVLDAQSRFALDFHLASLLGLLNVLGQGVVPLENVVLICVDKVEADV